MATHTVVTAGGHNVIAVTFSGAPATLSEADLAAIAQNIKDDVNVSHPIVRGAFVREGILYVPGRGELLVKSGDVVGYDSRGWPILLSADTIANGATWTYT